ncbi:MAG: hypothetical protein K2G92_08715, partial [Duncaniella sp.]|nr:hypothetical protein [Duncaniella sp.]
SQLPLPRPKLPLLLKKLPPKKLPLLNKSARHVNNHSPQRDEKSIPVIVRSSVDCGRNFF